MAYVNMCVVGLRALAILMHACEVCVCVCARSPCRGVGHRLNNLITFWSDTVIPRQLCESAPSLA